jgi:hypothetical protein
MINEILSDSDDPLQALIDEQRAALAPGDTTLGEIEKMARCWLAPGGSRHVIQNHAIRQNYLFGLEAFATIPTTRSRSGTTSSTNVSPCIPTGRRAASLAKCGRRRLWSCRFATSQRRSTTQRRG